MGPVPGQPQRFKIQGWTRLCSVYIQRKDRSVVKLVVWDSQNLNSPTAFSFELEKFTSSASLLVPQYTLKEEFFCLFFTYLVTLSFQSAMSLGCSSEVLTLAGMRCIHIQ